MALGSTKLLTEMSTRNISWGKVGRCVRLTTLPPSCDVVTKSGNLNLLETSGPLQARNGTALPLFYIIYYNIRYNTDIIIVIIKHLYVAASLLAKYQKRFSIQVLLFLLLSPSSQCRFPLDPHTVVSRGV